MSTGASIVMIAIGAILYFAVTTTVQGVDLAVVGVILMALGALGLVISLAMFGPWARTRTRRVQVQDEQGNHHERVEKVTDRGV